MFLIFHFSKTYGVMVQNGAQTLKLNIWLIDIMTMEYMHVALDACHDSILQCLQDSERVTPTHGVHPPPITASPLSDPPPKP
jgi:hypothetical protein